MAGTSSISSKPQDVKSPGEIYASENIDVHGQYSVI